MSDFNEFTEEGFDLKAWINRACSSQASEEPLERSLAELEMRLQLTAEEIEASLHDLSVQAMRRIPVAVQEIYRLLGEIQGMQDQLRGLETGVKRDATSAMDSVSSLEQLDKVKRNMESARNTLKEATELSGLFVKVEEVFQAGDLPRVAEILSCMRKSLSLVGDVPEFRAGRQKLRALEDRLQGMVEGSLADAFSKSGDEEAIKKLCALLLAVDRLTTVEQLYCAARLGVVQASWDEMVSDAAPQQQLQQLRGGDVLYWLPRFLSWLSAFLEQESGWCQRVLPVQQPLLVVGLCRAILGNVSRAIKDKVASAGAAPIASLVALQRELAGVAFCVAGLLQGSEPQVRREALSLVYAPVEDKVAAYGTLEQNQLAAELAACPQPGPATNAEDLVVQMIASSKAAFAVLGQAVGRCLAFTGGTELRALMRAVDQELSSLLKKLQAAVSAVHSKHSGAGAGPGGVSLLGHRDDSEEVAGTLRLLLFYAEVSAGLSRLEAEMRTTISGTVPKLVAAAEKALVEVPADAVSLRLTGASTDTKLVTRLQVLLQKVEFDPRFMALPGAAASLESLHTTITTTLSYALLAKVQVQLQALPTMPEWKQTGTASNSAVHLPSFHSYPLAYVTTIGEYLMTMPQQLEVLMSEEETGSTAGSGANVEELAAEWLDRVVTGAAAMYAEQVMRIPELGLQGGAQLAADVEYFCNVMSALHGSPPAALLTVQLFAGHPEEGFAEVAAQASADGGADMAMLRTLAGLRKLTL